MRIIEVGVEILRVVVDGVNFILIEIFLLLLVEEVFRPQVADPPCFDS
jgi:hypothetical protein